MTPYGILVREDSYSFEKALTFRQKKFGEMKPSYLIRLSLLMCLIAAPVFAAVGIILKDKMYAFYYLIQCAATFFTVYTVTKNETVIKPARAMYNTVSEFQIVLYEDRLIYGTPYSRGEYYYDEIVCCNEENGILTIIINKDFAPVSVCSEQLIKGNYGVFCGILREKLRARFMIQGVAR